MKFLSGLVIGMLVLPPLAHAYIRLGDGEAFGHLKDYLAQSAPTK